MRLTELTLPKLRPGVYMDDRLADFGIRVGAKRRSWIIVQGRGRVKTTIGHYPDLSLSKAREEAKRLLSTELDRTPSVSLKTARTAFLTRYENPRTAYQVRKSLERHFKSLDDMLVCDITHADIERCLTKVAAPSERLHAFRYLRSLFNWSAKAPRKWVKLSPMHGYDPPSTDKKGSRTLTDDELKAVWAASPSLFRLMLLWGTRNSETVAIRREWVRDGVLTIPGAFTKNGRDHAIPLCPLAEHVLGTVPGTVPYVFPGRWGDGHLHHGALGKLKRQVEKASGVKGWQLRDLRRTFRSNMARLGVSRDVCEVLINHAPPVLDEIYDRYDRITEKRAALLRYEHLLLWLLAQG